MKVYAGFCGGKIGFRRFTEKRGYSVAAIVSSRAVLNNICCCFHARMIMFPVRVINRVKMGRRGGGGSNESNDLLSEIKKDEQYDLVFRRPSQKTSSTRRPTTGSPLTMRYVFVEYFFVSVR